MKKTQAEKIENAVLYGNSEGLQDTKGESSHEHDEFIKKVFENENVSP